MLARVRSGALMGVDAVIVEVEVDMTLGMPHFGIVGLPDNAVKESKVRVASSIKNTDLTLPLKRVTVNLAPADIRKDGTAFDLPIALGVLASAALINVTRLEDHLFAGELALDGTVKSIRGALPLAVAARDAGMKGIYVPRANAREASVVEGIEVLPVDSLRELIEQLNDDRSPDPWRESDESIVPVGTETVDFTDVRGQEGAKRAMLVAAAGGHNALEKWPIRPRGVVSLRGDRGAPRLASPIALSRSGGGRARTLAYLAAAAVSARNLCTSDAVGIEELAKTVKGCI